MSIARLKELKMSKSLPCLGTPNIVGKADIERNKM